jgi:hypothetical protein
MYVLAWMMKQVQNWSHVADEKKKGKPTVVRAKNSRRKAVPYKSKGSKNNYPPAVVLQDISDTPKMVVRKVIHLHGWLLT